MKMSNKVYDVLVWISSVVLPFFITMIGTILNALKIANTDVILIILGAVSTCLGGILRKSNIDYKKKLEFDLVETKIKHEDENI